MILIRKKKKEEGDVKRRAKKAIVEGGNEVKRSIEDVKSFLSQKEFVKVPPTSKKAIVSSLNKEPIGKIKELGTKKLESRPKVYWTRGPLPGSKKIPLDPVSNRGLKMRTSATRV